RVTAPLQPSNHSGREPEQIPDFSALSDVVLSFQRPSFPDPTEPSALPYSWYWLTMPGRLPENRKWGLPPNRPRPEWHRKNLPSDPAGHHIRRESYIPQSDPFRGILAPDRPGPALHCS